MSESLKVAILQRNVPDDQLRNHLILNAGKISTWEAAKAEVKLVLTTRRAVEEAAPGPTPMDVGALGVKGPKGTKGGGKGKGKKGKGKKGKDTSGKGRYFQGSGHGHHHQHIRSTAEQFFVHLYIPRPSSTQR